MGRETYFPHLATLCHNAKVVHAFESNTPFEKLPGTQINVPLSIAPAAPPVPHFPRFRALALFGRRSPQCVDSLVMPASENLHNCGHFGIGRTSRTACRRSRTWASTQEHALSKLADPDQKHSSIGGL